MKRRIIKKHLARAVSAELKRYKAAGNFQLAIKYECQAHWHWRQWKQMKAKNEIRQIMKGVKLLNEIKGVSASVKIINEK